MNKEFCKILVIPNGEQVLITKEFDSDKGLPALRITVAPMDYEGVEITPSIVIGFKSEEGRDKGFNEFDSEKALEIYEGILEEIPGYKS